MATLTVQDVTLDGAELTAAAAAGGGDEFENTDERTIFRAINGSGAPITVTIDAPSTCNHGFNHDIAGAVPAGETWDFGPFDKERFNDSSSLVQVTYSGVTSLTVAAIRVPSV